MGRRKRPRADRGDDPSGGPAPQVWWERLRPYQEWIVLAAIVALAAFLRFYRIGAESIWLDESASLTIAGESIGGLVDHVRSDNHPPGYYLLLKGWIGVFGDSEAAIRSLSALIGIAGVVAIHWLARDMIHKRAGWIAATLMAVSQFAIVQSQNARQYALLATLATISMHAYWRAFTRRGRPDVAYYAIATAGLLYSHVNAIFVVAAQTFHWASSAWSRHDPRLAKEWLRNQALAALLFLPWLPGFVQQSLRFTGGSFWLPEPTIQHLMDTFHIFLGSKTYFVALATYPDVRWWVFWIALLMVFNATVASRMASLNPTRNPDDSEQRYPGAKIGLIWTWLGVSLLLPFILSFITTPMYLHRTLIGALPALLLLVAVGIARIQWRPLQWVVLLILVVPTVGPLQTYYQEDQREQWREAAQLVERDATPGALVVLHSFASPFEYYAERDDLERVKIGGLDENATADLQRRIEGSDEVWFVLNRWDQAILQTIATSGSTTHTLQVLDPSAAGRQDLARFAQVYIEVLVFKLVRA